MFLTALVAIAILLWGERRRIRVWRRRAGVDELRFLTAVHAELKAGASLRWALATAAQAQSVPEVQVVGWLALAGASLDTIAPRLRRFPVNGQRLAAAVQVAAIAGGRSSQIFARLVARSIEEADLAREKRTLTTQARMSAAVIGGLAVVGLLFGGIDRVGTLVASGGAGTAAAITGLGMELVGCLLVWRLATA